MGKYKKIYILNIFLLIIGIACQVPNGETSSNTELIIFAASSLKEPFEEIIREFSENHPHTSIKSNYAGSQKLLMQIQHGGYADIFASADMNQISQLLNSEMTLDISEVFAENSLSIIVNNRQKERIQNYSDLTNKNLKIVLGHPGVPIGMHSNTLINNISQDLRHVNPLFKQQIYNNVVSYENSVKSVIMKVVIGEADAGVVYHSDSTVDDVVKFTYQLPIKDRLNVIASYPVTVLKQSNNPINSKEFIEFLRSEPSLAILQNHGFTN